MKQQNGKKNKFLRHLNLMTDLEQTSNQFSKSLIKIFAHIIF